VRSAGPAAHLRAPSAPSTHARAHAGARTPSAPRPAPRASPVSAARVRAPHTPRALPRVHRCAFPLRSAVFRRVPAASTGSLCSGAQVRYEPVCRSAVFRRVRAASWRSRVCPAPHAAQHTSGATSPVPADPLPIPALARTPWSPSPSPTTPIGCTRVQVLCEPPTPTPPPQADGGERAGVREDVVVGVVGLLHVNNMAR
jgi:hypothetical protein